MRTLILCLGLAATISCSSLPPSLLLPYESYELPSNTPTAACEREGEKTRLIVFVHGVLGDATSTWRHSDVGTDWPSMLLSDDELNGTAKRGPYEALVFSYKTTLVNYSSNITEVAVQLRAELEKRKAFTGCEQIYFITHSMGGLVTKRMVLSLANEGETDRLARIRALFLIGTPTYGSWLGSLAKMISFNPQFQNMDPMDVNAYIQTLDHDWQTFLRKRNAEGRKFPLSFCAYEASPTFFAWVVNRVSAAPNCDDTPLSVDKDHIAIVKPDAANTEPYPMVKRCILEASRDPFLPNRRVVIMDSAYPNNVYDLDTQKKGGTNADDIIPILEDTNLQLTAIKELVYPLWSDLQRIKEINPGLIIIHLSSFTASNVERKDSGCFSACFQVFPLQNQQESFEYFLHNALEALPQTRFLIYSRMNNAQEETAKRSLLKLAQKIEKSSGPKKEETLHRVEIFAICRTNHRNNNPSDHSFRDPITQSVVKSRIRNLLGDLKIPQECPSDDASLIGDKANPHDKQYNVRKQE